MKRLPIALLSAAILVHPPAASAQDRGFVGALGGITFGTETSSIVGAQGGGRVTSQIVVFGELGRMQNVMPGEIQDQFDDLVELFELQTGSRITAELRVPAFYGLGGVRWSTGARVAPFVEVGAGVARLSADIEAEVDGIDVSDEIESFLDEDTVTEFLLALGGGVNARLSDRLRLDLGYRYTRIFTDDPAVNTSAIYGALKFWF